MYQVLRPSTSAYVTLRHHRYHLRHWGSTDPQAPLMLLAHGWMDVGASWQFMVDALPQPLLQTRRIIALDWRGFGLTSGPQADCYWFPDYLGDLDALIDHLSPQQPIELVGHSMGGNVVMVYAGVRPERIAKLVNLEGFGLPPARPTQAPGRMAQWLDELAQHRRGELALKPYPDLATLAARLMKTNPRLPLDRAQWLATEWAQTDDQGQWRVLGDAAHKIVNPYLYRLDEILEIYACIQAPVLAVEGGDDSLSQWWKGRYTLDDYHQRLQKVPRVTIERLMDAGHMLHHDQPQALAQLLARFVGA